jgi:hypothetical protein
LLDRKIGRFRALQDPSGVNTGLAIEIRAADVFALDIISP